MRAAAWCDAQGMKVPLQRQYAEVAVTEGDKVEAQSARLFVNGYGVGDLVAVNAVTDADACQAVRNSVQYESQSEHLQNVREAAH